MPTQPPAPTQPPTPLTAPKRPEPTVYRGTDYNTDALYKNTYQRNLSDYWNQMAAYQKQQYATQAADLANKQDPNYLQNLKYYDGLNREKAQSQTQYKQDASAYDVWSRQQPERKSFYEQQDRYNQQMQTYPQQLQAYKAKQQAARTPVARRHLGQAPAQPTAPQDTYQWNSFGSQMQPQATPAPQVTTPPVTTPKVPTAPKPMKGGRMPKTKLGSVQGGKMGSSPGKGTTSPGWVANSRGPSNDSLDVSPYAAKLSSVQRTPVHVKRALTLPPKPLFPPPQAMWQQQVMQPGLQPTMQPAVQPGQTGMQPPTTQQGRGRPATGVAPAAPPQTGMPGQPSAVAGLGGQSSTATSKGFGNTPVSSKSSKGSGSTKTSNAQMGYGGAMPMPPTAPMGKPLSPMTPPMAPMLGAQKSMMPKPPPTTSQGAPMGMAKMPMPAASMTGSGMSMKMGAMAAAHRVQLDSEKRSELGNLLPLGVGAGVGSLSAPQGHGGEGALRGMGRTGGLLTGAGMGSLAGGLGGAGLGAGLGALLYGGDASNIIANRALAGAGIGGLGGAIYGGVKGYDAAGKYMGQPSYDKKKKEPEKKKDDKKREKKALIETLGEGAGLEGGRALSQGLPPEVVKRRALRGMLHGPVGTLGMGLGSILGATAGGLGGAGVGAGLGALTGHEPTTLAGAFAGGGLGAGLGAWHGGKWLGRHAYNWGREGKDETDMAKAKEHKKDKPHGGE